MTSSVRQKIILSGGGTLGSVVPLLALYDELKTVYEFLWLGTPHGPEKELLAAEKISLQQISSGKWRRYWSWRNFFDPLLTLIGFIQSLIIIIKQRPCLIISAGSYVSVPVALAGFICRVPLLVHQLDYRPGLTNRLLAPLARRLTVSLAKSMEDYGERAVWTGSPVRRQLLNACPSTAAARKEFGLTSRQPVVLIIGGGTGASALNHLVWDNLYNLTQICQVLHLTGVGKDRKVMESFAAYHQLSRLSQQQMAAAYSAADVVISRAGMSTLAELAYLKKATIIIPLPHSHQEDNARLVAAAGAGVVLSQERLSSLDLYRQLKELLADQIKRQTMAENWSKVLRTDANEKLVGIIKEMVG